MLRSTPVLGIATAPVRHNLHARRTTVLVDRRDYAEPQQHPLHASKPRQVRLGKANAYAFLLRTLNRSVCVEKSAQKPAIEFRRRALDCGRNGLPADCHA